MMTWSNSYKPENEDGEEKAVELVKDSPSVRYVQMIAGLAMWGYLMWTDNTSATGLSELSTLELMVMLAKYGFAAILIKGVSASEFSEILRAWKGK